MCVVHKPHIPDPSTDPAQQKPLPILRNTMLDGLLGNIAALRNGRNSLRIPLNPLGIPVGGGIGMGGGLGGSSGGGMGGTGTSSGGTGSGSGGGSSSSGGGGIVVSPGTSRGSISNVPN